MGRKRQVATDTQGLVVEMLVHPADESDAEGGVRLLERARAKLGRVRKAWMDSAYRGRPQAWVERELGAEVEIGRRDPAAHGFQVQPKRWAVERTFAWLTRNRRLTRDYEYLPDTTEAWIALVTINLLLARLAPA